VSGWEKSRSVSPSEKGNVTSAAIDIDMAKPSKPRVEPPRGRPPRRTAPTRVPSPRQEYATNVSPFPGCVNATTPSPARTTKAEVARGALSKAATQAARETQMATAPPREYAAMAW